MTRINCVEPSELTGKHLVAEYREISRIFALVSVAIARGERPDDPRNPSSYVLGKGHVRFFYPRLGYINQRFLSLVAEMKSRGYTTNFEDIPEISLSIPSEWWNDWVPDDSALSLNRARIAERNG